MKSIRTTLCGSARTLVPIPASVVDKRGNAIVNLKLDDFELRVDGELRPLSDLTRSETSVRLAMLV